MPSDRTLVITAKPSLTWSSPTSATVDNIEYDQGDTQPNMPGLVNPVTGDIRLGHMPSNPSYSDNVDITIQLDNTNIVDSAGNHVGGQWAAGNANGMSGNPPATAYCWFIENPESNEPIDYTPITVPSMTTSLDGSGNVLINDDTPDDQPGVTTTYTFCLGLSVPTAQGR